MTTSPPAISRIDPTTRRVPPLGGFNPTVLRIELTRMLRNRRTVVFTLVLPAALFFVFPAATPPGTSRSATATSRRTSWSRWRCTAPR